MYRAFSLSPSSPTRSLELVAICLVVFNTRYVVSVKPDRHRCSFTIFLGCSYHWCWVVRSQVFFNRYHIFKKLCTSGIGLESSLLFAQEGANVLLVDVNLAAVEKAASLIKERVPNVKTAVIKADVSKEADVKAAVDLAVKEFGRLDVMVCGRVFFGQLHYYTHASYWL
jgi:hypothetical protein